MRSENRTNAQAKTKPKSGSSGDIGIGGTLALNRLNHTSRAIIADSVGIVGTPTFLTIDATAAHVANTEAENGAAGGIGIGAGVALTLVIHETHARLGSGSANTFSSASITANHSSNLTTKALATTAGSSASLEPRWVSQMSMRIPALRWRAM